MDYATIATMCITALSPFVKKGVEKLVEKTAEEGFNERKAIWEKVKSLFKDDDLILLNLLQAAESDVKEQGKLEGKLEIKLEANPDVAEELESLLAKLPKLEAKQNTMTMTGNKNIGLQDIVGSKININK